jgi:tetratricopeptide (TPR) repeat protein
MGLMDARGLAVSTTSSEALEAYERGLDLTIRWRSGALEALNAAVTHDPRFALGHCTRAFTAWRMGRVETALESHQQAMALADDAFDERERLHIQAVDAQSRGAGDTTRQILEQIAERYPSDRVAVRLLGLIYIAQGMYAKGIGVARRSLEACPDDPQFLTMRGFFLEQSGYNEEGLESSLRSLAIDPTSLYTYHAVGHAYQARGAYPQAVETFERAASLEHYPHIVWHLAESQAILGNERLTRDYWTEAAPPLPLYERIELLWRLEMLRNAPVDLAAWKELAAQGERLLEHANYLTIWMHHWIGLALARAGAVDKAHRQIERLRQLPSGRPSGHWSTLGADMLEGELALMQGDYATAVAKMAPGIAALDEMGGGSREQKDIFRDLFLEAHRRLGHADQVIELAQQRLLANPHHLQSLVALALAYGQTGQKALQRQAYRQLVTRADEAGAYAQAPELLDARQALQAAI